MTKLKGEPLLGIFGMGGIGKTTLAMVVYDTIKRSYEYTCFLRDINGIIGKNTDPDYLQAQIIGKMGEAFRWERLNDKKVLIVLDDVESESQVLGIRGFSNENRIIVTTRNSAILTEDKFECHFVERLDVEDSKRLFYLHAFERENALSIYKGHVAKFVEKCGRMPLALKVVAKYLYHKIDIEAWDELLERLRQAKPINGSEDDSLWSILRVAYDCLPKEEQEMSLDVAT